MTETNETPAMDEGVEIQARLLQRMPGEEHRPRPAAGRNHFVGDAILWLLWIPSSLILIVLLLDDLMS